MSESPFGGSQDEPPDGQSDGAPPGHVAPPAGQSDGAQPAGQSEGAPPGYVAPPGYGISPPPQYGQWHAPPPAPGGVPLRPLAVGDILSGAFTLVRRNLAATLGLAAIIAIISAALSTPLSRVELRLEHQLQASITPSTPPSQAAQAFSHFVGSFFPYLAGTLVITFVSQAILTGMLTGVLGRALIGDIITIAQAWRIARVLPVLGVTLLLLALWICLLIPVVAFAILLAEVNLGGLAIFVAVVGGIGTVVVEIWIYIRLLLAVPAVVLEGASPVAGLRRSWTLVQGSWWRVFGIFLLTYIMITVIGNVLKLPFTVIGLLTGALLGGAILTETIFAWPGVGHWLIESIQRRDYPVLQGGTLLIATLVILVNLGVDVSYGFLNPRIRR